MPVSCHFQGCKALLRTGKWLYIKYHACAFCLFLPRRVVSYSLDGGVCIGRDIALRQFRQSVCPSVRLIPVLRRPKIDWKFEFYEF